MTKYVEWQFIDKNSLTRTNKFGGAVVPPTLNFRSRTSRDVTNSANSASLHSFIKVSNQIQDENYANYRCDQKTLNFIIRSKLSKVMLNNMLFYQIKYSAHEANFFQDH